MIIIFGVIIILIIGILISKYIKKERKSQYQTFGYSITTKIGGEVVNVTKGEITPSSIENIKRQSSDSIKSRKHLKYIRYDRRERHKRVWAVLRFMVSIKEVHNSINFYDLDKAINEYEISYNRLKDPDFTPTSSEIALAIRFCTHKYYQGNCDYKLSHEEENAIYNWETFCLEKKKILSKTIMSFKEYWEETLSGYKRISAKKNRINYLINHLIEMKGKESLSQIPNFKEQIDELISYYSSLQ